MVVEHPAGLDQFGLTAPSVLMTILLEEKREPMILRLGAPTPLQVSMYAQVEHEPGVLLIGTYLNFSIRTFLDQAGLEEER